MVYLHMAGRFHVKVISVEICCLLIKVEIFHNISLAGSLRVMKQSTVILTTTNLIYVFRARCLSNYSYLQFPIAIQSKTL